MPRSRACGAHRAGKCRFLCLRTLTAALLLVITAASSAFAVDPLKVVRDFCRSDGLGHRLEPQTLRTVAPLVDWKLEPAWDRLLLTSGYEMATPRHEGEIVSLDVTYTVVAEIRPGKVRRGEWLEVHTFRLLPVGNGKDWRISGPPPIPHVFASGFDAEALAGALDPQDGGFPSNSAFVWKTLQEAGRTLPYLDTLDLARASLFATVEEPAPGDVAFYYDGEDAYHVGVVEAQDVVVSATMNGGVRRAPLDAFAGEVRFLRAVRDEPTKEKTRATAGRSADRTTPAVTPAVEGTPTAAPSPGAAS
jgi:hypothetical protein